MPLRRDRPTKLAAERRGMGIFIFVNLEKFWVINRTGREGGREAGRAGETVCERSLFSGACALHSPGSDTRFCPARGVCGPSSRNAAPSVPGIAAPAAERSRMCPVRTYL